MKRIALLVSPLMLAAMSANADVNSGHPTFTWQDPLTWTDNTPVTQAQITAYQLICSGQQNVSVRIAKDAMTPPTTYPTPANAGLPAGNYACTLQVYGKKTPADVETLSPLSNVANFVVPQPRMNAPTGFSAS